MSNKPTIALIPSTVGGSVYSVLPSNGDGDFNFTRASAATRINAQGLIETVAVGDNRLNYPLLDGTVQTCPHLLLEPQRTNLITYSESFSNWTAADLTVTDNNAISPNGTLNASKITAIAGISIKRIQKTGLSTTSVAKSYSIFVKTNDIKAIQLLHSGDLQGFARFDLVNYTVGSVGSKTTATIENYGNDWYRCTAVFDSTNTFGSSLYLYLSDSAIGSYGGTSLEVGDLFLYGAQYEEGSYPTSYIVSNSGSATTRLAEVCDGSGNASTFNDSEGVLMAQISALADDLTFRLIGVSDGTATNRLYIGYRNLSNQIQCAVSVGGVEQTIMFDTISDVQSSIKVLVKYKTNDFALWINGFEVATDTSGITFPANTLNTATFSSGAGSSQFYGKAKQVQYFDSALTDSELETLTSWMSFSDMAIDLNYTIQ
jgi:hypothetical protein